MSDRDRLLYRPDEAAQVMSISTSFLYELIRSGELRTLKLGRVRLVPRTEIEAWIARQMEMDEAA